MIQEKFETLMNSYNFRYTDNACRRDDTAEGAYRYERNTDVRSILNEKKASALKRVPGGKNP
jgi:hypothetical protein